MSLKGVLKKSFLRYSDIYLWKEYIRSRRKYRDLRRKVLAMPCAKSPAYKKEVAFCRWIAPMYFCDYRLNRHIIVPTPIFSDEQRKLWFVMDQGKKLYFPHEMSWNDVYFMYRHLCMEQDTRCAHCYCDDSFLVEPESTIFDIGAAEGIFTLRNIDRIKRAYLFECSSEWMNALEATFEPWKTKVTVVQKYVSDVLSDTETTIDAFWQELGGGQVDFIKMDIEGAEPKALLGADRLLQKMLGIRLAVCSYHTASDEAALRSIFNQYGYEVTAAPGHMLYFGDKEKAWQQWEAPYFRTAVLRAQKLASLT